MRHLDLFSGIGGFALAAQWVWGEDYESAGFSEINPEAIKNYSLRFPNSKLIGDIRKVEKTNCDIITAGFPCQDVSLAGKRKGLKGEQTGLFYELARIIEASKPQWLLLENVPGLLSSNGGKDMLQVVNTISKFGYCVCWRTLNARYFGVAQNRKRVFFVGSLGNINSAKVLFEQKGGCWNDTPKREIWPRGFCISTRDGERQDQTAETYIASTIQRGDYDKIQHGQHGNEGNLIATTIRSNKGGEGSPRNIADENCITYTLNTGTRGNAGRIWEETHIAEADTNREREADGISRRMDKHRGHSLGNAIVWQVAESIMQAIKETDNH